MKKGFAMVLMVMVAVVMCLSTTAGADGKVFDVKIWVPENTVDLTAEQVRNFNAENNAGITINATIEPVSEADATNNMIIDLESGADLYFFAQDQFARLMKAGGLSKVPEGIAGTVQAANDRSSVAAATSGNHLYAYPITSDNGYFMYYDKSVIPEEDVDSLEKLIADCEEAGKYFAFEQETSAWYLASFFFATGCESKWTTDDDGNFIGLYDTFDSPEGLIAAKGLSKLVTSPYHLSDSRTSEFDSGAAVVVSGTWDYQTAKSILGDNLGVADLPSFEVDGKAYHLGSFSGCKLLGVKPQVDREKSEAVNLLAEYLSNETCQEERFAEQAWGPSNLAAQQSDAVQANQALAALQQQNQYAQAQGQIHGSWWDIAKVIADDVKEAEDEAGLQKALNNYREKLSAIIAMSDKTDFNEDQVTDGRDAIHLLKMILDGDAAVQDADLNGDGVVDDRDLQVLMNQLVGKD